MEIEQLLDNIESLLYTITGSRKGSIGTFNNVYICQLDRKKCDALVIEVKRHLTSRPSGAADAVPVCKCVGNLKNGYLLHNGGWKKSPPA